MITNEIVRSWKDEDYLLNLSYAEQSLLPESPAGLTELTDAELKAAEGGTGFTFELTCVLAICAPTMDYGACSCFGCQSWWPYICFPN